MKQTALLIIAVLFTAAAALASVQAHQNDLGEIVEFGRTAWVQLYGLKRPLVSDSIFLMGI